MTKVSSQRRTQQQSQSTGWNVQRSHNSVSYPLSKNLQSQGKSEINDLEDSGEHGATDSQSLLLGVSGRAEGAPVLSSTAFRRASEGHQLANALAAARPDAMISQGFSGPDGEREEGSVTVENKGAIRVREGIIISRASSGALKLLRRSSSKLNVVRQVRLGGDLFCFPLF